VKLEFTNMHASYVKVALKPGFPKSLVTSHTFVSSSLIVTRGCW